MRRVPCCGGSAAGGKRNPHQAVCNGRSGGLNRAGTAGQAGACSLGLAGLLSRQNPSCKCRSKPSKRSSRTPPARTEHLAVNPTRQHPVTALRFLLHP